MKMYLISDNIDTQTGMRLAGVDGVGGARKRRNCAPLWKRLLADKEIGNSSADRKVRQGIPGNCG